MGWPPKQGEQPQPAWASGAGCGRAVSVHAVLAAAAEDSAEARQRRRAAWWRFYVRHKWQKELEAWLQQQQERDRQQNG